MASQLPAGLDLLHPGPKYVLSPYYNLYLIVVKVSSPTHPCPLCTSNYNPVFSSCSI